MKKSIDLFTELISNNLNGSNKGIYSICTTNSEVLEACLKNSLETGDILLIESTSNQVNQFGGYTGMKPCDFIKYVHSLANKVGFPKDQILFGGDHLGPNPWQNLPAKEAMEKSKTLIDEYVKHGYQKIHLDTSMFCADDLGDRTKPLSDEIVADRASILCKVAEDSWERNRKNHPKPVYIIGTEVPIPGGAQNMHENILPTSPEDFARTIMIFKDVFKKSGLEDAWTRVIGAVVQPGVEFGDDWIYQYQREKARSLSNSIFEFTNIVFEAHSTDYQTESNLSALVEDHFCILKVGPGLTFAFREAIFALEAMEIELLGKDHKGLSKLRQTLEKAMIEEPNYWKKYYSGDQNQQLFKRKYSFSDRSRYYWPLKELDLAKNKLFKNLRNNKIPLPLLSQFMPIQYHQVCAGILENDPQELVHNHIQSVVKTYSKACHSTTNNLL